MNNDDAVKFIAPGKVIITGEYSGIFHKKVVSAAINCYTSCSISNSDSFNASSAGFDDSQVYAMFIELFKLLKHDIPNINIKVKSNIPANRGLGSSAALINSFLMNYLEWFNKKSPEKVELIDLGKQLECYFHGKSSGIDIATSLFGGVLKIENGAPRQINNNFEFLKKYNKEMVVIDTGAKESSSGIISHVISRFPSSDSIWNDFNCISEEIVTQILKESDFSNLIFENHKLLQKISVIPDKVGLFLNTLNNANCYSKISGSGGFPSSGSAGICISFGDKKKILDVVKLFGYKILNLNVENDGARRFEVSCSAPGKLVLFGEHAVLHKKEAISLAINKRINVKFSKSWLPVLNVQSDSLNSYEIKIEELKNHKDLISKMMDAINLKTGINISISSEIPAGMGSSGALTVALLSSIYRYRGIVYSKFKLFKEIIKIQKLISHHQYCSGIDCATSLYGYIIKYKVGNSPKVLSKKNIKIYAIYSGLKTDIDVAVKNIQKTVSQAVGFNIYKEMQLIVDEVEILIKTGQFDMMSKFTARNQLLLEKLHLMNKPLFKIQKDLSDLGINDVKISGSGLGDYMVTFENILNLKLKHSVYELHTGKGLTYDYKAKKI